MTLVLLLNCQMGSELIFLFTWLSCGIMIGEGLPSRGKVYQIKAEVGAWSLMKSRKAKC